MRNPLLFSSDLLVKRALEAYDAPYKDVLSDKNKKSVQDFWTNLQSYPQEVQRQVYDQMAGIDVPGNTYGGFGGALTHAGTQTLSGISDAFGRAGNYIAKLWGGGRQDLAGDAAGLDTSERRRDSAKRVYNLAMQDPQYMARLQAALPQYENVAKNQAAAIRTKLGDPMAPPAAPNATAAPQPQTNTPAPVTTTSTPAPTQTQTPAQAPTPPAPVPAQAAAPAQPVAPTPTAPAPVVPATPTTAQQSNSRISYSGGEANLNNIPQNAQLQMGAQGGNRISRNRNNVNLISAPASAPQTKPVGGAPRNTALSEEIKAMKERQARGIFGTNEAAGKQSPIQREELNRQRNPYAGNFSYPPTVRQVQ